MVNREWTDSEKFIECIKNIKKEIRKCNTIVIEISSLKVYKYKDIIMQNDLFIRVKDNDKLWKESMKPLVTTIKHYKDDMLTNTTMTKLSKEKLIKDLDSICEYFVTKLNKKVIFVPHLNVTIDRNKIENRDIIEQTLKSYCTSNNVYFFNPLDYLPDEPRSVFKHTRKTIDIYHYDKGAEYVIKDKLQDFINDV